MRLVSTKGKRALDLRRKSAAALLLSTCFLIPHLANVATAFQSDEPVCPAHPVHDSECGYVEGVPEQPCLHLAAGVHDENCYTFTVHHHTAECYAEPLESDSLEPPGGNDAESGSDNENIGGLESENENGPDTGDGADSETGSDTGDDADSETGGGSDHENNNVLEASASLLNVENPDGEENSTDGSESDAGKNPASGSQPTLICQLEEGDLVRVLDCPHARGEHTEECGYAAAVEAVPCSHHCPQCPEETGIMTLAEEEENPYHAATEQQLIEAFTELNVDNGQGTIMLDADFSANTAISISNNCSITLDLNGHTITFRGDDTAGVSFLSATGNASLTIRDGAFTETAVEMTEVSAPGNPAASYSNGKLVYYRTITTVSSGGAEQQKTTKYTVNTNGRIVADNSGMANPRDCIISVGDGAKFTLESGMLANVGGLHNIVAVSSSAVEMSGGYLTGGKSTANGGGILAADSSTLNISGGVIAANSAGRDGGGIHYAGNGSFEIKGDTIITGNSASGIGGGVSVTTAKLLTLSNKVAIYGNTSSANSDCNSIAIANGSILNNSGGIDTSKITVGTNCEIEGVQKVRRGAFHSFLNEEWENIKNNPGEKVITLTDSYSKIT